ncbi:hypothetical protein, partial [Pseudomonas sp. FW215-R2]|uniref:hypothetical protein n=1 Tax=Pseudomonas sp. FW215-R2 TaxID=2070615 RepID=UPI001C48A175
GKDLRIGATSCHTKDPDSSKDSSRPATVDHRRISSSKVHIVVEFSRIGVHESLIRQSKATHRQRQGTPGSCVRPSTNEVGAP